MTEKKAKSLLNIALGCCVCGGSQTIRFTTDNGAEQLMKVSRTKPYIIGLTGGIEEMAEAVGENIVTDCEKIKCFAYIDAIVCEYEGRGWKLRGKK